MSDLLHRLRQPATREAAFRELVHQHGPSLHRHLYRMLPEASDIDDVLQNTLVKAFRNLDGFRGDSQLTTWLYRIATNEAISFLRSRQRRQQRQAATDPQDLAASAGAGEPFFDGDAAQEKLQRALAVLPPKQRAVFCFRYYDDRSYQEIAEITGTSQGALKASYHLAVKKITAQLQTYA